MEPPTAHRLTSTPYCRMSSSRCASATGRGGCAAAALQGGVPSQWFTYPGMGRDNTAQRYPPVNMQALRCEACNLSGSLPYISYS